MTYCIGWKNKENIFLVTDSAVTSERPSDPTVSSFGEYSNNENKTIEEAMLKLYVIEDRVIIATLGNLRKANEVIKVFSDSINYFPNLKESLENAIRSCGPFAKDTDIALIIGYFEKSTPKLISYNYKEDKEINEHEIFVSMGTLGTEYRTITNYFTDMFIKRSLADEHMLVSIISILQHYGIFDSLMRMYVGGVFSGLSLNLRGITWQPDISYIIYNPDFSSKQFITAIIRDRVLVVDSTLINGMKVLMNTVNTSSPKDWINRWIPNLKLFFNTGSSKFYVFLNNKYRLVTVVKINGNLKNKYFHVIPNGSGKFDMYFSPELMRSLSTAVEQEGDFHIRFNFLNADK